MSQRFIAFDVETPNSRNDRMSAIGISVIEDGEVVKNIYSLVNPQQHFEPFNVWLTGISPALVADQPTFGELWPIIEPYMSGGILAAHSAPFDMSVLAKCLTAYGIEWKKQADYVCTCTMGRRCYPDLPNHKLNTLCDHLGLELDHHNAGSDSMACAGLLIDYINQGMDIKAFKRTYDFATCRTLRKK